MNAAATLADLRAAGIDLTTDGTQLHCAAAPGVLTPDAVDRIRAEKAALIASLDRERFATDSRPDIGGDSALWSRLLAAAYDHDGIVPGGIFGALAGLRCEGARLAVEGGRMRLEAGEIGDEYPTLRRVYLEPHTAAIRELFAALDRPEAA